MPGVETANHTGPRAPFQRKRIATNRDQGRYIGYVINHYVQAVRRDDFEFLEQEEKDGGHLDLPCAFGMTPLMHAIVYDRQRIVAFLVEKVEADVLARSALGNTPLHFAYQMSNKKNRERMVKYLMVRVSPMPLLVPLPQQAIILLPASLSLLISDESQQHHNS